MKRLSKVLVIIMCLFILVGCGGMSKSERNKVINLLKNDKIIDKKWEEIDYYARLRYSMEYTSTLGYGYIYKDKDGNMYEVYISSYDDVKDDKNKEISTIQKYKIISIDETLGECNKMIKQDGEMKIDPTTYCSDSWVSYKDDKQSNESKYLRDDDSEETYTFTRTKHKILFFTYYTYETKKAE